MPQPYVSLQLTGIQTGLIKDCTCCNHIYNYIYTMSHSIQAAKLSNVSGTPLHSSLHSQQLDPVVVQNNHARAIFLLLESLDSETAPPDHIHIMVSGGPSPHLT